MRNQGRQKLARLSKEEFATLVWDILCDCKRRQHPYRKLNCTNGDLIMNAFKIFLLIFLDEESVSVSKTQTNILDEEPLYDSVASDDDYAIAEEMVRKLLCPLVLEGKNSFSYVLNF